MPANLHVRNVDDEVVRRLKRRAAENGRSAEAEHRAALQAMFGGEGLTKEEWLRRAARLREETQGLSTIRSEDLLREIRDAE